MLPAYGASKEKGNPHMTLLFNDTEPQQLPLPLSDQPAHLISIEEVMRLLVRLIERGVVAPAKIGAIDGGWVVTTSSASPANNKQRTPALRNAIIYRAITTGAEQRGVAQDFGMSASRVQEITARFHTRHELAIKNKRLLLKPIDRLGLTNRAANALIADGFRCLGDIAATRVHALDRVPNFGNVSLQDTEEMLARYHLWPGCISQRTVDRLLTSR
jgi:hypothetical protein